VRAVVLRGEGMGFSGGGDLALVQDMASDFAVRTRVWKEARDLVYNVINCDKPIVSAMHGPAVGAGLVAGLLADISIAAKAPRSSTATPAWAWPRATTPPSAGRCCAAWPRPSTT
jgi:enoyl-CoA hydratase